MKGFLLNFNCYFCLIHLDRYDLMSDLSKVKLTSNYTHMRKVDVNGNVFLNNSNCPLSSSLTIVRLLSNRIDRGHCFLIIQHLTFMPLTLAFCTAKISAYALGGVLVSYQGELKRKATSRFGCITHDIRDVS